jgi:hypothetical protein
LREKVIIYSSSTTANFKQPTTNQTIKSFKEERHVRKLFLYDFSLLHKKRHRHLIFFFKG